MSRFRTFIVHSVLLLSLISQSTWAQNAPARPGRPAENAPYRNAKLPVDQRVKDLIGRMTLQEKIGQMTQLCASSITLDGTKKLDLNLGKIREYIQNHHVGSFLSGTGKAEKWADFVKGIQEVAVKETRLGIPVIFGMDHVHGADYVDEATMFPHNLTLACSFDPSLAAAMGKITAIESADLGHHWNFAPVLDVGKNVNWPRLYETFGEDPYLCSQMGAAYIKGYQDCPEVAPFKQAACAKHFIGYSDPKYGWDRSPSEIPDQVLHEYFTPSFYAAFKAGVKTLMVNSGELNGEPVHGSKYLLTELLREKMGFQGVVLTDIKDINKMVTMHASNHDEKEATLRSIEAGIDMSMACSDVNFCRYVEELVKEGKLKESRLDESVARILKLKFELGLFEFPYPRKDRIGLIGSAKHLLEAEKAAEQSIVVLKNTNGILPIGTARKVLVAGFAANSKRNLNGPWTLEWQGAPEDRQPAKMQTLYQSLQSFLPKGSSVMLADSLAEDPKSAAFSTYVSQVKAADVVVITVGEVPYSEFRGNAVELGLPNNQKNLIKAAKEAGKPVVLVIISGRPQIITDIEPLTDAVLFAGYPGFGGGPAIAKIISGMVNPSGKLAFTWPSGSAHTAPYYVKTSEYHHRRAYETNLLPLYEFGSGLSYTSFSYSGLTVSDTVLKRGQQITARVTLKNTGKLAGSEAALWYLTDEVGTLTRPVKRLHHAEKVILKPGESKVLSFSINPHDHLSYPDAKANRIIEAGYFTIRVGDQKIRFKLVD